MTKEQRAFVEKLLENWAPKTEAYYDNFKKSDPIIAARRSEFERLFPRERA